MFYFLSQLKDLYPTKLALQAKLMCPTCSPAVQGQHLHESAPCSWMNSHEGNLN